MRDDVGVASGVPPLIYFVHVPKTAGSSLNAHLKRFSANGADHCESFIGDPERWATAVSESVWLSGHVGIDMLSERLRDVPEREVRLFSLVREPGSQLMSHYNWLIEIYHRSGSFYDGHPARAKEISEFIRSTGTRTPQDVRTVLEKFPGLFQDTQYRVVLGPWHPLERRDVVVAMGQYEYVATNDRMDQLFQQMTGTPVTGSLVVNKSRYHFDPEIFADPQLQEFLRQYNSRDYLLFDVVNELQAVRDAVTSP